jgi:hypothetical protein
MWFREPPLQPHGAAQRGASALPTIRRQYSTTAETPVCRALPRNRSAPDTSHRAYRLPHPGAAGHHRDRLLPDALAQGAIVSLHMITNDTPHATSASTAFSLLTLAGRTTHGRGDVAGRTPSR